MNVNYSHTAPLTQPLELPVKQNFAFLHLFKLWMWRVMFSAAILQCVFFSTLENIFAVLCVVGAWSLTDKLILTRTNLTKYSFSTIIIIGYSLTQYCLPLLFTLLEGKALTFNLNLSYSIFLHSLLALFILLIAHQVYKAWRNGFGHSIYITLSWLLKKNYFFAPPTNFQIWTIGFIGLTGMILTFIISNRYDGTIEDKGTIGKLIQGLLPYAYGPFFILLKPLFTPGDSKQTKRPILKIAAFSLLVLLISIGGNSRGLFMKGITAVGIAYFIGLLLGKFSYKIITVKNLTLVFLGIWIMTGPLSDLGTAMVIVRQQRSDITSKDLFFKTVEAFQDKQAIQKHKESSGNTTSDWDETYFDNIFLARFCNLKFNDASLELAAQLDGTDAAMRQYSIDRFWASLPGPILSVLKIDIDKQKVTGNSYGDLLYHLVDERHTLGGYRTGHFAGTGMAAFGWWYLLLLGAGVVPLFFLADLFVSRQKTDTYLSFAGLISITTFFTFFSTSTNSESVISIYTYLVRGWIQGILLFWFILFITRRLQFLKR